MATSRRGWHAGPNLTSHARLAGRRLALEPLERRDLLTALPVMLTNLPLAAANISEAVQIGNITFFTAYDDTHGTELWKTNGTVLGTVMIKDIREGGPSSNPSELINVNGTLYFKAYEDTHGTELWKSDGSATGTVLVKDIYAGSVSSDPSELTNVNGTLFFTANDGTHGIELWKSNGTATGTLLVDDIRPGSLGSDPSWMTPSAGVLFFTAYENTHGRELWRTDGTTIGTELVDDIRTGSPSSDPQFLTDLSGTLIFTADDGIHGQQLWNLAPTLVNHSYVCDYETALSVSAADGLLADTTHLGDLTLIAGPAHGSVELADDGSFVYTPVAGFTGSDSFTYQATDFTNQTSEGPKTNIATAQIDVVRSLGDLMFAQFTTPLTSEARWYSFETHPHGIT